MCKAFSAFCTSWFNHKCEGISPLGYWQKVNQSPTQTKPYNALPPFEQRDSWSSYGVVRAYSEVLDNRWGPRESDLSDSWHEEIHFSLKSVFMVDMRFELTARSSSPVDDAKHMWRQYESEALRTGKRLIDRLRPKLIKPCNISTSADVLRLSKASMV